jgi:hypothetical protein
MKKRQKPILIDWYPELRIPITHLDTVELVVVLTDYNYRPATPATPPTFDFPGQPPEPEEFEILDGYLLLPRSTHRLCLKGVDADVEKWLHDSPTNRLFKSIVQENYDYLCDEAIERLEQY